jgi:hypothetical protein
MLHKGPDAPQVPTGEGLEAGPEEPVVDQEKVGALLHGRTDGRFGRVHRGHDPVDFVGTLDLQPVQGVPIVRMLVDAEVRIQILEERF